MTKNIMSIPINIVLLCHSLSKITKVKFLYFLLKNQLFYLLKLINLFNSNID